MNKCKIDNCNNTIVTRGLCNKHYHEGRRNGTLNLKTKSETYCTVEGCNTKSYAKGYCRKHYIVLNKEPKSRRCSVEGCDNKHVAKGLCMKHYQRLLRHGNPLYKSA